VSLVSEILSFRQHGCHQDDVHRELGVGVHACKFPVTPEEEVGGLQSSEASLGKTMIPYPKNKLEAEKAGSMAQVAERLPSKHEALEKNAG
jgi:hypothetical protein